jgi:hypothetical protein
MNLDPFYSNPANAAMPYLQQIPGTITPYYQPYINAGNDALNTLIKQYSTLLNNPGQIISQAGSGYQESPGYQYNYNAAENANNAAAAAGGSLGTTEHQNEAASTATNLANEDYQTYLNQALGLYSKGLQGEQGLNTQGYNASNSLATSLGNNLESEAGLAYNGVASQNAANSGVLKDITGLTAGLLGATGGVSGLSDFFLPSIFGKDSFFS